MNPTISESKKETLLELIEQLEDKESVLSSTIEEVVHQYDWNEIEPKIDALNSLIDKLREEIYYS
jgi:predicted component of type VI protein secretion system